MKTHWNSRIAAGTLCLALVAGAGSAPAQTQSFTSINPALNCAAGAGGCTIRIYGFASPESYLNGEPNPYDVSAKNHNSFGQGSYFYTRSFPVPGAKHCGSERGFVPIFGQIRLREESDCVPPVLGLGQCIECPAGGCTNGSPCDHFTDCPGGLCNNTGPGCPVEVPTDLIIPGEDDFYISPFVSVSPTPFGPIWVSVAANGDLTTDGPGLFEPDKRPGLGRRFRNPAGTGTIIRWNDLLNGGGDTGRGQNYSVLCCNDAANGLLCTGQLFNVYPTLTPLPARTDERTARGGLGLPRRQPGHAPGRGSLLPGPGLGDSRAGLRRVCQQPPGRLLEARCPQCGGVHRSGSSALLLYGRGSGQLRQRVRGGRWRL